MPPREVDAAGGVYAAVAARLGRPGAPGVARDGHMAAAGRLAALHDSKRATWERRGGAGGEGRTTGSRGLRARAQVKRQQRQQQHAARHGGRAAPWRTLHAAHLLACPPEGVHAHACM
eukprot:358020-Chlamydomonas_euryale.AAC.17